MSLIVATPALAQEDGVFIDPGSPSGKEYAIPLESERRMADPEQRPSAAIQQGSRSSPLFGTGIAGERTPQASSSAPDSDGKDRDPAAGRDAIGESEAQTSGDREAIIRGAAANPGAPDGGAGVPLTIGGVAAGVLLVGGLAGLLLRRRV